MLYEMCIECAQRKITQDYFFSAQSYAPAHIKSCNVFIKIAQRKYNCPVPDSCLPVVAGSCSRNCRELPICDGYVNDIPVKVLRDTGCTAIIVKRSLVKPEDLTGEIKMMVLINRIVVKVPVAMCFVRTPMLTGFVEVLCLEDPICELIIGNVPGIQDDRACDVTVGDEAGKEDDVHDESRHEIASEDDEGSAPTSDEQVEGKPAGIKAMQMLQVDTAGAVTTRARRMREAKPCEPLLVPVADQTGISVAEFREKQRDDPSSKRLWESATASRPAESAEPLKHWFEEHDNILYRYCQLDVTAEVRRQLVVPRSLRAQVLRVAHETIMSGHQGVKKTLDRIMRNFYWPGMYADCKRFCASCDICQRTVPRGTVSRVPLQRIPIVRVPFEKVAIDLVGPLKPVSDRGHRWILTLVDFATRYPEAVALKSIDTEVVAEALIGIFSRVGLPNEILSDNGSQFVSGLMKEVARLLSITWVCSTPYHPQSNVLCEKWNGSLKRMLKRMCAERTHDWDRYLEPLMFAYRGSNSRIGKRRRRFA